MEKQYIDGYLINYSSNTGYPTIWINKQNTLVHRYVWEKHNGKIPKGSVVHHKDENKLNFSIENLILLTNSEHNRKHAIENKLGHTNKGKPKKHVSGFCGVPVPIIAVRNGETIRFESISQASKKLNIKVSNISRIVKGLRKSYLGWRFYHA